jgi:hypothetical protein
LGIYGGIITKCGGKLGYNSSFAKSAKIKKEEIEIGGHNKNI